MIELTQNMDKPAFLPSILVIPMKLVQDKRLDQVDRLLYGVVYWYEHMKEGRCFASNETMAEILGTSVRVVQNSLTSLEKAGYIARTYKDHTKRNRLEIKSLFTDFGKVSPTGDRQKTNDLQITRERSVGDTASDLQVTRVRIGNKNREKEQLQLAPDGAGGKEVNAMIEMFRAVNPSHERLFAVKPQRAAIERMLLKHGKTKLENAIHAAVSVAGKPYAPTITTPLQLESKLGQLSAYWRKEAGKGSKLIVI